MQNMNWMTVRSKRGVAALHAEATAVLYPSLAESKEMLGMRLCVLHNLYFYNTMMEEIRDAIDGREYKAYKKRKLEGMEQK